MKATINGVVLEGTPEEMIKAIFENIRLTNESKGNPYGVGSCEMEKGIEDVINQQYPEKIVCIADHKSSLITVFKCGETMFLHSPNYEKNPKDKVFYFCPTKNSYYDSNEIDWSKFKAID